jgi:1L-myo-inositol 1-phosphate cytidylyltransferase
MAVLFEREGGSPIMTRRAGEAARKDGPKCVIIAAGRGSRLADRAESKPLLEVGGKALIDRAIDAARRAGVREFVVVTGYAGDAVEAHLRAKAAADGLSIATVRNDEWEKENGLSVLKARGLAGDRFFLMMADHIVDPGVFEDLGRSAAGEDGIILAVDRRVDGHPHVDLEDVTKVKEEGGRIAEIGKNIGDYNAFDTGVFLCTPALFEALEESQAGGDFSLSGGVRRLAARGQGRTCAIGDKFWIDVDDERALAKAEAAVAAGVTDRTARRKAFRRVRKHVRLLLSAAGLLLFVFLLATIGTAAVVESLARFGPWLLVIFAVALAWLFVQAWAWHLVQRSYFRPVPLLPMFRARIICDALNTLIPAANVGGEAARAFLIKRYAPLTEGIPGVLADKTIEFFATTLFLALGFLVSLLSLRLPGWMTGAAAVSFGITFVCIGVFIVFQRKGVRWTLDRVAKIVPGVRGFIDSRQGPIKELDANMKLVYSRFSWRTIAAAGLHFANRLFGVAEVYIVLRVLGTGASVIQALFISTGVTLINTAFFFVPGHFGIMESGHVLILQSLGFTAALGLSLGVIRRIRKLAMAALGLLLYALAKAKST